MPKPYTVAQSDTLVNIAHQPLGDAKLAIAIAIDLNPNTNTNAMGRSGNMDPRLVDLFERHGFIWGGRWAGRNKDPMHFQYCSGY